MMRISSISILSIMEHRIFDGIPSIQYIYFYQLRAFMYVYVDKLKHINTHTHTLILC